MVSEFRVCVWDGSVVRLQVDCGFGLGDLAVRGHRCNLFARGLLSRISCAIVCVVGDFGFVAGGLILVSGCGLVVL